jgi:N-acylneuraminate cytidylyltransferase
MLNKKEVIAIIPARGGSKGIARKNLCLLDRKPLIAHTILDAKESKIVDRVYVSTEDPEIASVSSYYGAEVIVRPRKLAGDRTTSEAVLLHALEKIKKSGISPNLIVFLQCTSPIRTAEDIDKAILTLNRKAVDSLLSVSPSHRFIWEKGKNRVRSLNYDYRDRSRRQDMPPQYLENGSIYIFKPWILEKFNNRLGGKITLFEMSHWSSFEIDTIEDFKICDWIMKQKLI